LHLFFLAREAKKASMNASFDAYLLERTGFELSSLVDVAAEEHRLNPSDDEWPRPFARTKQHAPVEPR
jgi:hypothetical protein